MERAQFISLQTYGRQNNKKSDKRTLKEIIGEAARNAENSPHIKNPKRPPILFGIDPREMLEILEIKAAGTIAKNGTALRKDAQILLAGVVSYPLRVDEITKESLDQLGKWTQKTIQFLSKEYGENLRSVVCHTDEKHPHLHFYAYQDDLSLNSIHPAKLAEAAEKKTSKNPSRAKIELAGKKGLELFQQRYYDQVSEHFIHKKTTVKRRRLNNFEHKKQQAEEAKSQLLNNLLAEKTNFKKELASVKNELRNERLFSDELKIKLNKLVEFIDKYCKQRNISIDRIKSYIPKF